jgi:DNA-binding transcriptional MerR regulator
MTRVTVKALRFYEEEGLIEPAHIDPATGYRYYDSNQLPLMHRIVALKQCGFPVAEIKAVLSGKKTESWFKKRKQELEEQVASTTAQLASINHYLTLFEQEQKLPYEIVLKELPKVLVYSKRMVLPSYDSYFVEIPKIGKTVTDMNPGIKCVTDPPYCFVIYHDGEYRDTDIDIEFCEAVDRRGIETDGIIFKVIEGVPVAACALHQGPYASLPQTYSAVFKWIEDNNYQISDFPRESYIDGIWNRANPDEWITEIQFPIVPCDPFTDIT